ncbi:MAG: CBS domain-containing protein [Anaerolineales bacterium]|nr:CBS domain-containing protein [Anaerolineales bacterium]
MGTVRQILETKGSQVWTITPDKTVFEALRIMGEKEVGALVVVNGGRVTGIISERDYARKVILQGKTSRDTLVLEIMTSPALVTQPQQTVQECMSVMTDHRIRHLPVVDNEQLVGMISLGDLVKSIIDEQQFKIAQLENYIGS